MLSEQQLQELHKMLLTQKEELVENHSDEEHISMRDSVDELSTVANHPADLGTELYEREKDMALDNLREDELNKIDQALQKMKEGTYGICEVCGKDIPFDRLTALPFTLRCVEHSEETRELTEEPVLQQFKDDGENALEMVLEQGNLDAYDEQLEGNDSVNIEDIEDTKER